MKKISDKSETNESKARLPAVIKPPAPGEYLPAVIQRKVIETSLTHPVALYPTALGVGSALVGWIVGAPFFYWLALAGLIGPIWATVQWCFLGDRIRSKYTQLYRQASERETANKVFQLEHKLVQLGQDRGAKQLAELQKELERFKQKLNDVIGADKPEFEQYLINAQTMCLAAINNLVMVVDNALDIQVVDQASALKRLVILKTDIESKNHKDEITLIERKISSIHQAEGDSEELIKEVEETITTLFEVTRSLSDIGGRHEDVKLCVKAAVEKFTAVAARNKRLYDKIAESWREINKQIGG